MSGVVTRLWTTTVEASFEADNADDAASIVRRLTERVLDDRSVWNAEGEFDAEQVTETVDA